VICTSGSLRGYLREECPISSGKNTFFYLYIQYIFKNVRVFASVFFFLIMIGSEALSIACGFFFVAQRYTHATKKPTKRPSNFNLLRMDGRRHFSSKCSTPSTKILNPFHLTGEGETRSYCTNNVKSLANTDLFTNVRLSSYLAGLVEGDGTIAVHDPKSKSKKY
jgi:hypothetical protein